MEVKTLDLSKGEEKDAITIGPKSFIKIRKDITDGSNCIKRFINRHRHIEKSVSLSIEDIQIPDDIVVKDCSNLFTICHGKGADTPQSEFPVVLKLSDLSEPFYIQFNAAEITDCRKFQHSEEGDVFEITYKIILRDCGTDELIEVQDEKLQVQFKRVVNVPKASFFLNKEPLQYKSKSGLRSIGHLSVKLSETLKYAPSVDLRMKLKISDQDNHELDGFLKLKKDGKGYSSVNESNLRTVIQADGKAGSVALYELFVDMDRIVNPMDELITFTVSCDSEYKYSYQNSFTPFPEPVPDGFFCIAKDKQETELVVEASQGPILLSFCDGCCEVPEIQFTSGGLVYPVKFLLRNKATDISRKGAGLTVSNLRINSSVDSGISFYSRARQLVPVNDIIKMQGQASEIDTEKGYFIANGENAHTEFKISFNPSDIYTVYNNSQSVVYSFDVKTALEFDYEEDAAGRGNCERKHFYGTLNWHLYKNPNPEWLCVDFGTSAIVCHYGRGADGAPIDLNKARADVYRQALKSNRNQTGFSEDEIRDRIESSTPFISSDILFNDVQDIAIDKTTLCSQLSEDDNVKYNRMSVLLSPTEKLTSRNFRRQLPCLKILMGNDCLPENDQYRNFKYRYCENGQSVTASASDASYSLLKIENIFSEAYFTLFRYFIQDESIKDMSNKVVLTYPNTYTPRNLMIMKSIVEKTLPFVREVRFVSESDAVAAYYIDKWGEYHVGSDNIQAPENILVYDMGAGTLDVTYLTKRFDKSSGKFTVEICGKIGTGRAGNYLDYVIGQILAEKLAGGGFKKSWISTEMKAVELDVLEARVSLKSVIKSIIKPALSENEQIRFSIGKNNFEIAPLMITEHKLFVEFLHDATVSIWDSIRRYVGEDNFKVDTVIASGRSLRLMPLYDKIKKIAKMDNACCIMLDRPVSGESAGKATDRSKTAVVEGARTYVDKYMSENTPVYIKSRRLQASYGVAFTRVGGTWDYREILDRKDIPYNFHDNGEFRRSDGPVRVEHTNESAVLLFIQTYLSEEETRVALNANKKDYISVMSEVMMSDLGGKESLSMDVIVDRNNNISLYVDGRETQCRPPKGVDLNDITTKRSLWPVSIANE